MHVLPFRRIGLLLVAMSALGAVVLPAQHQPARADTGTDVVVGAAGDIACAPGTAVTAKACHQGATAKLLADPAYQAVLALGDEQYKCGTLSNFQGSYAASWGTVAGKTFPIPGDNDYASNDGTCVSPGAVGYFQYFADRFSVMPSSPSQVCPDGGCPGYYSTDIGAWHVVALNSECTQVGVNGCTKTSPQYKWLVSDLSAHPATCQLAIMHKPYWGNGTIYNKNKALVQALYNAGVDLLLSGHEHIYERFAPQNLSNAADPNGVRQFVVGTGGVNHGKLKTNLPNTEIKDATHFGVLRLTMHDTSYDWAFVADDGTTVDSGSASCH